MTKRPQRFIPKPIFQTYAFSLLAVWLTLVAYWTIADSGLFYVFHTWLGLEGKWIWLATFFAFVTLFPVWVALVLPVRIFAQLPTPEEELGASLKDGLPAFIAGWKRLYAREKAKNEEMYTAKEYTPELRRRARAIGVAFFLVGLLLTPAAIWSALLTLERGHLFEFQIALLVIAPLLLVAGVIQLITGKSVIRK